MSIQKEVKELIKEAKRQGWRVKEGKHYKLYAPDGETIVVVGKTPSDRRSLENSISDMRKAGFRWKGR